MAKRVLPSRRPLHRRSHHGHIHGAVTLKTGAQPSAAYHCVAPCTWKRPPEAALLPGRHDTALRCFQLVSCKIAKEEHDKNSDCTLSGSTEKYIASPEKYAGGGPRNDIALPRSRPLDTHQGTAAGRLPMIHTTVVALHLPARMGGREGAITGPNLGEFREEKGSTPAHTSSSTDSSTNPQLDLLRSLLEMGTLIYEGVSLSSRSGLGGSTVGGTMESTRRQRSGAATSVFEEVCSSTPSPCQPARPAPAAWGCGGAGDR